MATYEHDADGDEDNWQRHAQQANNTTEELAEAIAERPGCVPVDAKAREQAECDENDTPDIAAVTMQDPHSIWGNDVSFPRRVRAIPCCSGPAWLLPAPALGGSRRLPPSRRTALPGRRTPASRGLFGPG